MLVCGHRTAPGIFGLSSSGLGATLGPTSTIFGQILKSCPGPLSSAETRFSRLSGGPGRCSATFFQFVTSWPAPAGQNPKSSRFPVGPRTPKNNLKTVASNAVKPFCFGFCLEGRTGHARFWAASLKPAPKGPGKGPGRGLARFAPISSPVDQF